MIDVIPTLQTLRPQDVAGRVAVVIDVLRATSTIVAALAAGAAEIRPALTPDEARRAHRRLSARCREDGCLLGGERQGLKIEGFDLGNSPLEYTPEAVGGKVVFFTTTNGTRTLRRAAGRGEAKARRVLVASFLNATAVAERLGDLGESVVMACAGTRGGFSLEDILLAGCLVDHLQRQAEAGPAGTSRPVFRDLARAAATLYRSLAGPHGERLEEAVTAADHAHYLAGLGFAADVAYCAGRDRAIIVPEYRRGRVCLNESGG